MMNKWVQLDQTVEVLHVRMTANQATTAGVWAAVAYNVVDVDTQGGWNAATREYTPKVAGWYRFQLMVPSAANHVFLTKALAGVAANHANNLWADGNPSGVAGWVRSGRATAYMNGIDDTIRVWVHTNAAATIQPGTGNYFLAAYKLIGV